MKKYVFLCFVLSACTAPSSKLSSQWSSPILLSGGPTGSVASPTIAVSSDNFLHVAWGVTVGSVAEEIYYTFYNGAVWSFPQNISQTSTPSMQPLLLAARSQTLHLVFGERVGPPSPRPPQQPTDLFYRRKTASGWSNFESIFHSVTNAGFPKQHGVVAPDGSLYVVWQTATDDSVNGPTRIFMRSHNSGGWSAPSIISAAGGYPSVAISQAGNVIYSSFVKGVAIGDVNSVLCKRTTNGGASWSDSIIVHRSGAQPSFSPQILTDAQNRLHIIWLKALSGGLFADAVFHSVSHDNGSSWTVAKNISQGIAANFYSISAVPDLVGRVHLVMQGDGRMYYTIGTDSVWSSPEPLFPQSSNATETALALDSTGVLHLVWADYSLAPQGIYYSRRPIPNSVAETRNRVRVFSLAQNFPNPFNPTTNIEFNIGSPGFVNICVFDVLGAKVADLISEHKEPGRYSVAWKPDALPSGVYFGRMTVEGKAGRPGFVDTIRMVLVR